MIRFIVRGERAQAAMRKLMAEMTTAKTKPVIEKQGHLSMRRLIQATPKKWTGQTRRGWKLIETTNGFAVTNPYQVMLFLEKGTRAHGPVRSKFLYIPLVPSAMIWHPGLKRGRDFVLARRVKGIKARNIVTRERPVAREQMLSAMRSYVDQVLRDL